MNNLLKKIVLRVICAFIFFGLFATSGKAELVDRIVAIVNDDIISLSELNEMFEPYAENIKSRGLSSEEERAALFKVREDILSHLIDQKLTDQETKRFGISVKEKEIDKTIERIKESNFYTDEDLRKGLARQNLTMEEYRERIREQILRSKLVNMEIRSRIVITKEDIKSYYDSHSEIYQGEKKYHLRHILLEIPSLADETGKLEIKEKADAMLEKIKTGEPFENMARKYSQSSAAAKGGDLGMFGHDVLSPQLRETLKGMKAGEVTPVLDTDLGYQIFLVQEIRDARAKSLEEASPEIQEKLYKEIVDKKFQSWLESLRKRSHIKIIR
ncbi:Chaperone SurA N-terminal domain-containing protein [Desulfonema magnum]|uniref:Chaperone SurA N-terminal domain-containing protein n=1 Tax=Desulfonema magnum TaxID=45655 RepID=A0A975BLX0_9BACT|nr:Chaperone SurA N-terminal domain-containing protein [Desulfonema magnum]